MTQSTAPARHSNWFLLVAALFVTCLIVSNIIAVKVIDVAGYILPAAIIIFPISYILGDVLTEMVGQEILVGMKFLRANKRANQNGSWVDTNEAREYNEIDKVFYPDGFTVTEKAGEAEEATFLKKWKKANPDGTVIDKVRPVAGAPTSKPGTAAASTAAAAPDDLFSD